MVDLAPYANPAVASVQTLATEPSLEIDLAAIRANYRSMRARFSGQDPAAVLKSNAYGLGLEQVAASLDAAGCATYWVNDFDEARRLRSVLPGATVFALLGLGPKEATDFARIGAIPVLASIEEVDRCCLQASATGAPVAVAIQLDTGLGRLGLTEDDVRKVAGIADLQTLLDIRCWVSHLSAFDLPGNPMNDRQRRTLVEWTARLPQAPVSLSASSGIFMGAEWHFDIARIGSALFGVQTSVNWQEGLVPCYRLAAPVLRVARLPAGAQVGYRGATTLSGPARIATLALGYSHGLPQAFANVASAFVGDRPVPFVGGVAMNLTMIDVSDLPEEAVGPGTVVDILGGRQTVDTVASELDCAPNVLLTQIGAGCRHVYVDAGGT